MKNTLIALALSLAAVAAFAEPPETVVVTYRAKKGAEADLQRVIARHWAAVTRLGLVLPEHALYRGEGKFIEIFTWKDASIPDAIPAEVGAIWKEMSALVDGKNGLQFTVVERILTP